MISNAFLALIGTVLAPIVTAILAVLTARIGIGGQIRQMDLLERRLKLLTELSKHDIGTDFESSVRREIETVAGEVLAESLGTEVQVGRKTDKKFLLWRYLDIPKVHGWGRIVKLFFYIYFAGSLVYLLMIPFSGYLAQETNDATLSPRALLGIAAASLVMSVFLRHWTIVIAKRQELKRRARNISEEFEARAVNPNK